MRSELNEGRRYAFAAIVAHEFGHAMQRRKRCSLTGKWLEMHADYMGGYYVGYRHHSLSARSAKQAYVSLAEKGDYNFNNIGHHGTPEERASAFEAGFRCGLSLAKDDPNGENRQAEASKAYRQGLTLMDELRRIESAASNQP